MRKLASVERVLAVAPIEGADAIEVVTIKGWQVVVKKNEFKVGDLGIYLEIDSIPPDTSDFNFLWAKNLKDANGNIIGKEIIPRPDNYRLKTVRLRGQISQGLFIPLTHQVRGYLEFFSTSVEGVDVTELLGVTKYEPPINFSRGNTEGLFPSALVPKTDEERVQSCPSVLETMVGIPYVMTLKYDGTSATFLWDKIDEKFKVCSRNLSVKEEDGNSVYWKICKRYRLDEILSSADFKHLAIQGEIFGPGIQKNRLNVSDIDIRIFSIYDMNKTAFLPHSEMVEMVYILNTRFGLNPELKLVDVVEEGDSFSYTEVSQLLDKAKGFYPGTKNHREGIVIRPRDEEQFHRKLGGRLSFKAINNDFLLSEKD